MSNTKQTNLNSGNPTHRRHRHYVDGLVQGRLLLALLLLELLLFGGAMIWLYLALDGVIERNMYRVHFSEPGGLSDLQKIYLYILPTLLVINFLALWLADRIWRKHVNNIIDALRTRLQRIGKLDLRAINDGHENHHEVLDKAKQWREYEYRRYEKLGTLIGELADELPKADKRQSAALRLEEIRALMK